MTKASPGTVLKRLRHATLGTMSHRTPLKRFVRDVVIFNTDYSDFAVQCARTWLREKGIAA